MQKNKTLVLGASENPQRYSNRVIKLLDETNEEVIGIGRRKRNGQRYRHPRS